MTALAKWQAFYEIVGSSAGALIGLQFVVMSLIVNRPAGRPDPAAGNAFATPNIVHFAAVLGLSAILAAPWDAVSAAAILWGALGFGGLVYTGIVTRRMRKQTAYRPEFEDWLFHSLLPLLAYLILAVAACAAPFYSQKSPFGAAGAALLLLFCGIHNAWDAVTYHVFFKHPDEARRPEKLTRRPGDKTQSS